MRAALLVSAALLIASPAFAQSVTNDQYQSGSATASTTIDVGSGGDVGATAIASGNVVTAGSDTTGVALDSVQHMDGDTNAGADAIVWDASGNVAITSAAVANGATVTSNGDTDINATQYARGNANAETRFAGGTAGNAGTSASASGNVGAVSVENGQARVITTQESTGGVSAIVEADHCCVGGQVVSGAISSSNNLSVAGETATVLTDTHQAASGSSIARVDLYAGYATDASGNATANGNSVAIDNQWGYVNARVDQRSSANVAADSYVTLGGDFLGFASAGAYGVGNQATVSNVGSDTVMDVTQDNSGDISADAAMAGEGGSMTLASSAAYGNNVSGTLCGYCDTNAPGLTATNRQTNSGDVSASAVVTTPRANMVGATATAIGNAATYQVSGPS